MSNPTYTRNSAETIHFHICPDILANTISREAVTEISTALYRFTHMITEDVHQMDRPPLEEAASMEFDTFRLGSDFPESRTLLRNLSLDEQDPGWRDDILSAAAPWDLRFQDIANRAGEGRLAAGLAQDLSDLPPVSDAGLAQPADPDDTASEEIRKLENLYRPSYESLANGDPLTMMQSIMKDTNRRIEGLRRIARRHPTSALAHSELGSRLGWAGSKIFGDRSMIDEAIAECKIAAMLREGWDLPLVEPAIFLSNAGYHEEALRELEWAKSKLPEKTPHFAYAYGYTQMVLGRFSGSLRRIRVRFGSQTRLRDGSERRSPQRLHARKQNQRKAICEGSEEVWLYPDLPELERRSVFQVLVGCAESASSSRSRCLLPTPELDEIFQSLGSDYQKGVEYTVIVNDWSGTLIP